MNHIAVIGAGELGGAVVHALARHRVALKVTLVDGHDTVAAGKTLDISQAAPIEGFATDVASATDIAAISGADVVVVADRFREGDWDPDEGLELLRRLAQMASRGCIVCAGAAHHTIVGRGIHELRLDRHAVLGSAPEALVTAARALVALAVDGSPRDVALSILGLPPSRLVVCWEHASLAGSPLAGILDSPTRQRLGPRIAQLWPPGPHALAAAAVQVIEAIDGTSRRRATCFVAAEWIGGRSRIVALQVRLGRSGIVDVILPDLSVAERVALDNAMMV